MRLRLLGGAAGTLLLAGCGGGDEAEKAFKPLSFGYLTPLRLNVGQIQVEDHVPPPGPDDLAPQSPEPPDRALRQMAQDRIVAAGSTGTAVFSIDQAAITGQPGAALNGQLAVHLDIIGSGGGHSGYAEAHVSRQFVPGTGTDNDGLKAQLYGLTSQMMQDMNVEFEFQLRRTLGDWMLDASGAPVTGAVEQQALPGPGSAATSGSPSVGAPVQLAPPPSSAAPGGPPSNNIGNAGAPLGPDAVDPAAGAPMQLSPPPGVLQPPPGSVPAQQAPPLPPPVPVPDNAAPNGGDGSSATPSGY